MTATQEQLAKLAALVGITPETHRHLFSNACSCGSTNLDEVTASGNTSYVCSKCGLWNSHHEIEIDNPKVANLPALDTPAGDDVFLAPVMRWLHNSGRWFFVHLHVSCGSLVSEGTPFTVHLSRNITDEAHGATATLALLRACQSARVPEIVEIFGKGE